ncbi:MRT4 [Candida pseudojiufengensis]|uniref:MRT4 n=1 Tax=Candida pseudojiufengensis TaxID=497109 RepID=UPI0022254280|nr:MRT4 [Candida pseudojiufengensis]KAI5963219.1 MRT4 [Candida pseudojiufengensis]
MPKSKRSKLVTLSQTDKKGKEAKTKLFDEIRNALDSYSNVYILQMKNIRTPVLQDIRSDWSESKLIMGKRKVIQKSFGETIEEEYLAGLAKLTKLLNKSKNKEEIIPGVLFTNENDQTVKDYFDAYTKQDYTRVKSQSPITFEIPEGIVYSRGGQIPIEEDIPMSHSLEETLRNKYKIPTKIKSGKIILEKPYLVCNEGDILDVRQALILKQFGIASSEFKVPLVGHFNKESGEVEEIITKDEE